MVNNITIINKMNNHLSPLFTEHKKGGGDHNNNVGNPSPVLKQAQKCVGGGGGLR
jgi:hypothetical protein